MTDITILGLLSILGSTAFVYLRNEIVVLKRENTLLKNVLISVALGLKDINKENIKTETTKISNQILETLNKINNKV